MRTYTPDFCAGQPFGVAEPKPLCRYTNSCNPHLREKTCSIGIFCQNRVDHHQVGACALEKMYSVAVRIYDVEPESLQLIHQYAQDIGLEKSTLRERRDLRGAMGDHSVWFEGVTSYANAAAIGVTAAAVLSFARNFVGLLKDLRDLKKPRSVSLIVNGKRIDVENYGNVDDVVRRIEAALKDRK